MDGFGNRADPQLLVRENVSHLPCFVLTRLYMYKSYIGYSIPYFLTVHFSQFFEANPALFSVGGNTNGVNTFTGLDIGNYTQGVINGQNLLVGDNFVCLCKCLSTVKDYHLVLTYYHPSLPATPAPFCRQTQHCRCGQLAQRRTDLRRCSRRSLQQDYPEPRWCLVLHEQLPVDNSASVLRILCCTETEWRHLLSETC